MSRSQYIHSDMKEKHAQGTQGKEIQQPPTSKQSIDKWPIGYKKVTTSSALSQQKTRTKNQQKESEILEIYGRDAKGTAGRSNAQNLKPSAESQSKSRAKSQKYPKDIDQIPMDPKTKRLEEFRTLIGNFEYDDSFYKLRNSEVSNKVMPNTLQTMTPTNNRLDTKQSHAKKLKDDSQAIEEQDKTRVVTEQQQIVNTPQGEDKNPLNSHGGADKAQEALQDMGQKHNNAYSHQRNLQNIYHSIEEQFLLKQRKSLTRDWIAKNKNEKPQPFRSFQKHQKNWNIDQIIILEMWDEESQAPKLCDNNSLLDQTKISMASEQELSFQRMLINNMDAVFKIFFTGMTVLRVKKKKQTDKETIQANPVKKSTFEHIEQNLSELERRGIVQTRVRSDTGVKQFHAGQIFDYLKDNMQLKQNQCLLVLTNADLYPKDGWTFVFGMTKQSWRICIQSYARHHPNFAQNTDQPTRMFDAKVAKLVQYRAIKTACHELCHVLSMRHCQMYECIMNGSSQLDEADQKPFALCPVCLRKLSYYLDFEGQELQRYRKLREVIKIMNHKDPNQCYQREIVLFSNIITSLTEVARNTPIPVPRVSQSCVQSDKEGGTQEMQIRMDKKMLALQQAHFEAQQLSDGFSSEQLTHQPLSSARLRPYGNDANSSEISLHELQIYRGVTRHGHYGSFDGIQDEKTTIVQKMRYYICGFSCLQRPDESKNEYQTEQFDQIANQNVQDPLNAKQGDKHQKEQSAAANNNGLAANKRSAKLQFKEKRTGGQQSRVKVQRTLENNDDYKMLGDNQRALGRLNQNVAGEGEVVEGAEHVTGPRMDDGRNNQKVDPDVGDNPRGNQKKSLRILDVDENMRLQKIARKSKNVKEI